MNKNEMSFELTQPQLSFGQWHYNPHHILGLHSIDTRKVIRLFRPGANSIYLEVFGQIVEAVKVDAAGFFEYEVPQETTFTDYRVYHQNGHLTHDPYAFVSTFGEIDAYLFGRGVHYRLYQVMGARICTHQGIRGVKCAVWAPNAKSVSVLSDFNHWDGRVNPMRSMGRSGIWELFIPGMENGVKYKFEIRTQKGEIHVKS